MATLPDVQSLGMPKVPVPDRPMATYQPGIAEGADVQFGQGLAKVGQQVEKTGTDIMDVQDRLAQSAATTQFLNKKLDLDTAAQSDPDYTTLPARYAANLDKAVADASSGIRSNVLRAQFQDGLARIREYGIQATRTLAKTKQTDADKSWLSDQINTGINTALSAPDEPTRIAIFDNLNSTISDLASPERGSITQQQADKYRKAITETYAEKRATNLVGTNPTAAVDLLKPTGTTESGDPIFAKTDSWLDHLDPAKRVELYEKAKTADSGVAARSTADSVLSGAVADHQVQAGKLPTAPNVSDAILSQESGGKANPPTSTDGAVGPAQIMPDTFARYAKPGEDINNPDDNKAVGQRIIADLQQKYPNDPARVAVAYFSGEGNVAPKDSPTPYLRDTQDGNGKSVSSYVADVTGRLKGANTAVAKPVQSQADYFRANYADIVEQARQKAIATRPDDQRYIDLTVSQVEQRMNAVMTQDRLANEAAVHTVYQAFNGDLSKGIKPTSVEQMIGTDPSVKAAWDRLNESNPTAALAIETRILTENSKSSDHDVKTYGAGFYELFNRVHANAGDPNRITDETQLYPLVGDKITVAGLDKLKGEINARGTPEATAVSEMKKGALAYAKHQLSFEADYGSFKVRDPKGEDAFNVGFVPAFYQAYDAGIKQGKTPFQLLSKDSPDFIVDKLAAGFKRTPQQMMQDRINAGVDSKEPADNATPDLTTKEGIVKAYRDGKIARDAASQALIKGGFASNAPQVPVR